MTPKPLPSHFQSTIIIIDIVINISICIISDITNNSPHAPAQVYPHTTRFFTHTTIRWGLRHSSINGVTPSDGSDALARVAYAKWHEFHHCDVLTAFQTTSA
mmetsp:Transcript_10634/g.12411  ORF Transcript_10634/g.12411 Transcript_10634/m.12411 type:complete len:102 (-) Transcript_10634:207-512(-)